VVKNGAEDLRNIGDVKAEEADGLWAKQLLDLQFKAWYL
jgi:hypothetical protein